VAVWSVEHGCWVGTMADFTAVCDTICCIVSQTEVTHVFMRTHPLDRRTSCKTIVLK
jgi:hypothetical protein